MQRALGLIVVLLFSAIVAFAAGSDIDTHVTQDSSQPIYADSAFAHGYRHGYEEGFHAADRDLHLSLFEPATDRWSIRVPKVSGYQQSFGSKELFRRGFNLGFRFGYSDSANGKNFRLIPPQLNQLATKDRDFDHGVQAGFEGQVNGCQPTFTQAFCSGVTVGRAMAAMANDVAPADELAASNGAQKR